VLGLAAMPPPRGQGVGRAPDGHGDPRSRTSPYVGVVRRLCASPLFGNAHPFFMVFARSLFTALLNRWHEQS
jgi:hypothetical protein